LGSSPAFAFKRVRGMYGVGLVVSRIVRRALAEESARDLASILPPLPRPAAANRMVAACSGLTFPLRFGAFLTATD
jgi:hypothetical protein